MSTKEMMSVLYGYSRAVCKTTPLDHRDVAHVVVIKLLPHIRSGRIRHLRAYMYMTITCVVAHMMKSKHEFAEPFDFANIGVRCDYSVRFEVEEICRAVSSRECFVIRQTIKGYSRKEIADQLGLTRNCVNIIWFRMVKRLRGKL